MDTFDQNFFKRVKSLHSHSEYSEHFSLLVFLLGIIFLACSYSQVYITPSEPSSYIEDNQNFVQVVKSTSIELKNEWND